MSKILYNVKRTVLTPLNPETGLKEEESTAIFVESAEEVNMKPVISKGEEKILRTDDAIIATATQKDLTYGYDVELKDNRFDINLIQLVEGGTIRYEGHSIGLSTSKDEERKSSKLKSKKIIGYDSPMLDDGNLSKPFMAEIYVEERKGSSVVGYVKVTLNWCTGSAPEFNFKRGEFYSPSFSIIARENTIANKPIKSLDFVKSLPEKP